VLILPWKKPYLRPIFTPKGFKIQETKIEPLNKILVPREVLRSWKLHIAVVVLYVAIVFWLILGSINIETKYSSYNEIFFVVILAVADFCPYLHSQMW
jgi:hypothetical protein